MITKGIRISDIKNGMCVPFYEILEEINNGSELYWSILFLFAHGFIGGNKGIPDFKQVRNSEKGLIISWIELNSLARRFEQIIDLTLIGCKDLNLLHRYEEDQTMYETCDITIEMIDGGYWEVFSQDGSLIARLAKKFKEIIFLTPDFEK